MGGVAFRPSGNELAAAGTDPTVALWDAATGRLIRTLRDGSGTGFAAVYDPDGTRLAAAGTDRTVRIWNLSDDSEPIRVSDMAEGLSSLAFRPDGRMLATGGGDPPVVVQKPLGKLPAAEGEGRTIRLWDPVTGHEIHSLHGHVGSVHALSFSPDDARLASAGADQIVRLWDPTKGNVLSMLKGIRPVFAVAFSPDGRRLASAARIARSGSGMRPPAG